MLVHDIVRSAAFKCGLIPSFNPGEIPGDIIAAGREILAGEILPGLNCDRTIDITVTSRVYTPKNGIIVLTPLKQPNENFEILGYAPEVADTYLNDYTKWAELVRKYRPTWVDAGLAATTDWGTNELDEPVTVAVWTVDMQLLYSDSLLQPIVMPDVNVDFPVMRVDTVLEENSRIKYEYVYREEFDQILNTMIPGVYTTEEYDDKVILLIKGTPGSKRIVLPVPLQIINVDHEHSGMIIAPEKFRRYLIDTTAVSLAIVYGLSTVDSMKQQAAQSYELLKKNKPQPLHKPNVSEEICDKLRRDIRGRRFYANF